MNRVVNNEVERESNIELLRLLCMVFIVAWHLIIHGLHINNFTSIELLSEKAIYVFMSSFFIVAVNCFILISGYFSIRPTFRGFVKLYSICVFYGLAAYFITIAVGDQFWNLKDFANLFFPFSCAQYWFIGVYFYLFLISPLLNKATESLSKREFVTSLILLSIITFYFGFLRKGTINSNGYNLMNFAYLYVIGRYLNLHTYLGNNSRRKNIFLASYVITALVTACLIICFMVIKPGSGFWPLLSYNSPILILSAISLFLYMKNLSFKSKIINYLASSSLAIYLIDESHVMNITLSDLMNGLYNQYNTAIVIVGILVLTTLICFGSILIDKVRIFVMSPVERFATHLLQSGYKLHNIFHKE